ncbi:5-formyltetrahydrofolate cyclo-ligase [Aspergillus glaucus CBS 516.65]|uniref:5-formyltetrahydrofolate cyclo-ligase n=1 Tax=Aspergillus glaucus CBS 516.65 TaxID=1160497 RepID=A0A1L9VA41_ASPGL|nr:hypothetical protein ASPGLDRAFT_134119 [Aspergillus glaucus CBS 516.65]OJJ80791.1 hypothetical protein ASPGLDRAFT_134119 [Aspergillus glaucus CBS 516.65]
MTAPLQAAKKDLRKKIRDALRRIPADSLSSQSGVATNKLFSLTEYQNAKRIGVYLSMPSGELSTTSIIQDALTKGKEVFIPYIYTVEPPAMLPKTSVMDMLTLESVEEFESLEADKWGIPSLKNDQVHGKKNCFGGTGLTFPAEEQTTSHDTQGLDLIVMPGMAFDQDFRRLGHGKGYYDHFLTRYSTKAADGKTVAGAPKMPFLVALALQEQMLPPSEEIPVTHHDWPIDALVVGDGKFFVRQR